MGRAYRRGRFAGTVDFEMSTPQPRSRRRANARTVALRAAGYFVAAWGTLTALASGTFPGAAFRLLVVRPFLYANLLLPLVAGAGVLGALAGAPFGLSLVIGRWLAGSVLAIVGSVLIVGYIGSRWLVVRHVDAFVRDLPSGFDGLRIA